MRNHVLLTIGLLLGLLGAGRTSAQTADARLAPGELAREGIAGSGLCGLALSAYPTCPERVGLAGSGSYGYTESVGPVKGAHHRMAGTLGVGVAPLSWLALALRLDSRFDWHPPDEDEAEKGPDVTGTGEPRLLLRLGQQLTPSLSLGGEAVVWLPGNVAPSFEPRATTVDLKALLAWSSTRRPIALLANVGFRLDQSARSAPPLDRLRAGDRAALGVSDFNSVLVALGASTRALARSELFAELSLDLFVGSTAGPYRKHSPLRGTLGARRFLSPTLQAELSATVTFQERPRLTVDEPLLPVEPRALISLGLRYGFNLRPPPPPPAPAAEPTAPAPVTASSATVAGLMVDDSGAPLPDVRVQLRSGELSQESVTDGEGRYSFRDVPLGPATLEATASGFEPLRWTVEARPDAAPEEKRQLVAKADLGTLRLLTRTFTSEPLTASVLVRDARGKKAAAGTTNAEGLFEFDLPPGRYVVMISASGYRPHRREVQIERYGVAILNVDMREQK